MSYFNIHIDARMRLVKNHSMEMVNHFYYVINKYEIIQFSSMHFLAMLGVSLYEQKWRYNSLWLYHGNA